MDIFNPITFYYTLTFAISLTMMILGGMLLGLHIAPEKQFDSLRFARKYLSISYFVLGISGFVGFLSQEEAENKWLLASCTLIIASYQALLFTYTILALIQPLYIKRKYIFIQFGIITVTGIILVLALSFAPQFLSALLFFIVLTAYFFQIAFYAYIFRQQYRLCLCVLENYYDDDEHTRLRWAWFSFYSALAIGLLALVSTFLDLYFYILFSVSYTVYYAYMVSRIYNYQIDFKFAILVITKENRIDENLCAEEIECNTQPEIEKCKQFEIVLDRWVKEKKYTQKDVSVDEIADSLQVNRSFLQYYFRTCMHTDFRSWRSELRIREAQMVLKDDSEISLEQLRELVGFNHRANFHQQFQKITGLTPTEYRQQQSKSGNS